MGTFGGGVAECCVFAETADAESGDGGSDDYSGGVVDGGVLFEEGSESGNGRQRIASAAVPA